MTLELEKLKTFLTYKQEKIKSLTDIEQKRLEDLKDSRSTIFKYALPATIIDGVGGVVGTIITASIILLLPIALFLILIYFLARFLDREKYAERLEIMEYTETSLYEIRMQEIDLLGSA
ncbi:MAG: hypothetical protein AUI60_01280 [Thaumarchaeota archaeon 13_1_40CM_2_39_4]|nr:MAG: hypothetical protein AUH71_05535 [Thaumarchaeota archaeon 13_1_40CM_4_48_7]OLC92695.1 MAG: hypothetical protein AUI92_04640 [Thaumarchaeota archaeon 13_1_40CM_3_38_6]OLD41568.1 MAG: hypothetical protein AUI60_01280 [Thaumarchaeota archaeon 13_1_40CM_2_39_4]